MVNPCGHEWIVSITQQTEEPDLDQALLVAISELPECSEFALYINKHFNHDIAPQLLNPHSSLEKLDDQALILLLNKVSQNKVRVSSAFGYFTSYIPVYYLGKVIGVLLVKTSKELSERYSILAMHMLNVYANQLALIHKSRLDPLTELLNRQTFDKKVLEIVAGEDFLSTCDISEHTPWFLAIVDIDHFKRVNDNFGHVIGDEVILLVSRLLKNNFRMEDYIFRYGGEEFAVLFKATGESDAGNVLNRFRGNVAEYPFPQIGNLTISAGFLQLDEVDMVASIVHKADLALYHSKNNGRNQVTAYSELGLPDNKSTNNDDGIELF